MNINKVLLALRSGDERAVDLAGRLEAAHRAHVADPGSRELAAEFLNIANEADAGRSVCNLVTEKPR